MCVRGMGVGESHGKDHYSARAQSVDSPVCNYLINITSPNVRTWPDAARPGGRAGRAGARRGLRAGGAGAHVCRELCAAMAEFLKGVLARCFS